MFWSIFGLEETYSDTMFGGEKTRTLATFAAHRAESEDNADIEKQGAKLIADASKAMAIEARGVIDVLMAQLPDYTLAISAVSTATTQLNAIQNGTSATNFKNARQIASESASTLISSTKSANASARENTVNAAEKAFTWLETLANTAYSIGSMAAWTNYLTSATTAGISYADAMKAAGDAYTNTIDTAGKTLDEAWCRLTGLYNDAINIINSGGTLPVGYFQGTGSTDVQVCFVAGTPILLSDGTSKPIEKIEIGDEVFARPHDNPTDDLVKCKVVQVFHNAPQSTFELTFDNGLVICATKEHPFFVEGHGWVPVADLQIGTRSVSANGTITTLTTKRFIKEQVPVYNFEVEQAHTYFVGESQERSLFVHNDCPTCGGNHPVSPSQAKIGSFYERTFYWMWGGDSWSQLTDCEIYLKKITDIKDSDFPSKLLDQSHKEREFIATAMEYSLKTSEAANTAAGVLVGAQGSKQVLKNVGEYVIESQTGIPVGLRPNFKKTTTTTRITTEAIDVIPNHPPGYTTSLDTTAFGNGVNLASEKRTLHILIGEDLKPGGHQFPGNAGKTLFPSHWSSGKIMEAASEVATNPNNTWTRADGLTSYYYKNGKPARFTIIGEYEGIKIKVVIEPAGEGIITAHPIQ